MNKTVKHYTLSLDVLVDKFIGKTVTPKRNNHKTGIVIMRIGGAIRQICTSIGISPEGMGISTESEKVRIPYVNIVEAIILQRQSFIRKTRTDYLYSVN